MGKSLKKVETTSTAREAVTLAQVEDRLLTLRDQAVLLDSDVAALYGVATKEVNQAIKNNPEKFPAGYIIQLGKDEWENLRSKFLTANKNEPVTNCDRFDKDNELITNFDKFDGQNEPVKNFDRFAPLKHSTAIPKAFTEKGLYMLATILKGRRAVEKSAYKKYGVRGLAPAFGFRKKACFRKVKSGTKVPHSILTRRGHENNGLRNYSRTQPRSHVITTFTTFINRRFK